MYIEYSFAFSLLSALFCIFLIYFLFQILSSLKKPFFTPYGQLNIPVRTGFLNDGESSSSTMRETSPVLGERHEQGMNKDSGNLPNFSSTGVVVREGPKYYCLRTVVQQTDCLNTNVLDCSVTFSVDKNICVVGVQVPTQIAAVS